VDSPCLQFWNKLRLGSRCFLSPSSLSLRQCLCAWAMRMGLLVLLCLLPWQPCSDMCMTDLWRELLASVQRLQIPDGISVGSWAQGNFLLSTGSRVTFLQYWRMKPRLSLPRLVLYHLRHAPQSICFSDMVCRELCLGLRITMICLSTLK
jgi:hypothetical protein